MSFKVFAGYVQAIVGGALFCAFVFLLLMQWDRHSEVWIYGLQLNNINTAVLMMCSAVGGALMVWAGRALWHGIAAVQRARSKQQK